MKHAGLVLAIINFREFKKAKHDQCNVQGFELRSKARGAKRVVNRLCSLVFSPCAMLFAHCSIALPSAIFAFTFWEGSEDLTEHHPAVSYLNAGKLSGRTE